MATILIVKKAVLDMKERTGSSLIAINKWIETNEKVCQRIRSVEAILCLIGPFLIRDDKTELQKPHTFCVSLRNGEVDFSGPKRNWIIILPLTRQ